MSKKYKNEKEAADALASIYKSLKQEIGKVIIGQEDVVEKLLIALFCKGHSLLVGVPGLAKTLLISTVSRVLDLEFSRIQFTPDLMPGDILGSEILEVENQAEALRRGIEQIEATSASLRDELTVVNKKIKHAGISEVTADSLKGFTLPHLLMVFIVGMLVGSLYSAN